MSCAGGQPRHVGELPPNSSDEEEESEEESEEEDKPRDKKAPPPVRLTARRVHCAQPRSFGFGVKSQPLARRLQKCSAAQKGGPLGLVGVGQEDAIVCGAAVALWSMSL